MRFKSTGNVDKCLLFLSKRYHLEITARCGMEYIAPENRIISVYKDGIQTQNGWYLLSWLDWYMSSSIRENKKRVKTD
jgi:hypothetical protein